MSNNRIFVVLAAILILFSACKRNTTSKNLNKNTPLQELTKDDHYMAVNPGELAKLCLLDTASLYVGEFDDEKIFIKISYSSKGKLQGKYYVADTSSLFMRPHQFELSTAGRKYRFVTGAADVNFAMKYQANTDALNGVVELVDKHQKNNRLSEFSFKKYKEQKTEVASKRYQQPIFKVKEERDLVYGRAKGPWTSLPIEAGADYAAVLLPYVFKAVSQKDLDLTMDLYLPMNDTLTCRPLLVLIHGGAFFFGDKHDAEMVAQCRHYASLGYVVASINYRMGFELSKVSIQRCAFKSIQDAHAAMRFLVHHAEKYGIDKNRLYIGGSSAGSITAMNMVYMTDENKPLSTQRKHFSKVHGQLHNGGNNFTETFQIRGLINMWGALYEISDMQKYPVSIISFHGDADKVVPYGKGYPFAQLNGKKGKGKLCEAYFDEMYGSSVIAQALKNKKVHNEFYPLADKGHAPWRDEQGNLNDVFYFIQKKTTQFLYDDLVYDVTIQKNGKFHYVLHASDLKNVQWHIQGGVILSKENDNVEIRLFKDASAHQLSAQGLLRNDAQYSVSKEITK